MQSRCALQHRLHKQCLHYLLLPTLRDLLMLHDKMYGITTLATTEAFENAFGRRHGKRRRFFVVERTQTEQIHPAFLQGNKIAHHILYLCGFGNAVYGRLINHVPLTPSSPQPSPRGEGWGEDGRFKDLN